MTNLEFFKDKIIKETEKNDNLVCAICLAKNKECVNGIDEDCPFEKDLCNWLCKEHKEKIPLKQWEYDLIHYYSNFQYGYNTFSSHEILRYMKKKGYFKGVHTDGLLSDIVNNSIVVDDTYEGFETTK